MTAEPSGDREAVVTSRLEREIAEQGEVLRGRLAHASSHISRAAEAITSCGQLVIAARGSSDNAARFAQYLLGREARVLVTLATPSLYREADRAPRLGTAAVMGISQSGRSPDVVAVLTAARAQGRPTIALTNDPESELAEAADVVLPMLAGAERSVAATKTYTASLLAIVQLAEAIAPAEERRRAMAALPDQLTAFAREQLEGRERFDALRRAATVTVLGRGLQLATAHESALKLRELTGTFTEAFSPPDLMHGPIAALGERSAVWIVADEERVEPSLAALHRQLAARVATTVVVAGDPDLLGAAGVGVALPPAPAWARAILGVVPAQVAALGLAEASGADVDEPHGLTKVTLTI